jgi:hypothetical protein
MTENVIEFRPLAKSNSKIGYTVEIYYGPKGVASVGVTGEIKSYNDFAEDLEKIARSIRSMAVDDEDKVVATFQVFQSSRVYAYMGPTLDSDEGRAWLHRRLDDAKELVNTVNEE